MSASKRTEALLNEYKGNLYEFLTGHHLARLNGIESNFMSKLREDFFTMLSQQEAFIREYYPWLLIDLSNLAQGLGEEIQNSLDSTLEEVLIVGKTNAADKEHEMGEADLLLKLKNSADAFVSVKLSKAGSFVNTKSAGIKSFLDKYFSKFKQAESAQREFSLYFDKRYQAMAYELCDKAAVAPSETFEEWRENGLSELPGELSPELRAVFLNGLYDISNYLFKTLHSLNEAEPELFKQSLLPLIGYSRSDMIQATTFYKNTKENYKLDCHRVENAPKNTMGELVIEKLVNRPETSSFDVVFSDRILQIRVKAMNKFTGKGFKVNCAVKN